MRRHFALLAGGLAAVFALAGCATEVAEIDSPDFSPKPRCPKVLSVNRNAVEQAVAQVKDSEDFAVMAFDDTLLTPTLTLGLVTDGGEVAAADVTKALGATLACTDLVVDMKLPDLLAVLPGLGLANLDLELYLNETDLDNQPWLTTTLGYTPGLTTLTLTGDVRPGRLPQLGSVKVLTLAYAKVVAPDFAAIAERFPSLEVLTVGIDQDADWLPPDLAGLTSLKALNFSLSPSSSPTDLAGVSQETLDLILQIPATLPNLETLNGLPVAEATQAALAPGGAMTRAERKAEEAAKIAIADIQDWGQGVKEGGWATGGNAGTITAPVLIYNDTDGGNSATNGVRGQDWNGIPAGYLCQSKEECASVVVVDHRPGAVSGNYVPTSGTGQGFNGHLGETTVTVYDVASSLIRPVVVAATTEPPDTVYSEAEAIGSPDLDKAWSLILARLG